MLNSTELIYLHKTKFGENSLVIHTISKEYGRRSFLVKNASRKSASSLFLPLNILEAEVQESSKSKLYTVRGIVSRHPLLGIRNSFRKNAMTMFMSEVLYRVIKDGAYEPGLYELCEKDLFILDALQTDFSNFHIRFLLELAVALGFSPEPEALAPFMGAHLPMMSRFLELSLAESMLVPLSGEVRNDMAERLLRYLEYHTESSINVNSLKVLRELFQDSAQI